jgi:hypothetical protein
MASGRRFVSREGGNAWTVDRPVVHLDRGSRREPDSEMA